jgi:secreted PhoX family phosphatase
MSKTDTPPPGTPRAGILNRRQFFSKSAASAVVTAAAGGTMFDALIANVSASSQPTAGYGPLAPKGPYLALPPGFQCSVVSAEGETMDDGYPVPKAMDGMAAFPLPNGNILLIRNHEDSNTPAQFRPRPAGSASTSAGMLNSILDTHYGPRAYAYDEFTGGGTTSIEVEPGGARRRVSQHWSLVGTLRNCAGGPTPWGSWLSCEEAIDSISATGATRHHGYVFEVPTTTTPGNPVTPVPLPQLGRFNHEAASVDPATGIIYETEDQGDTSGLYRFVPSNVPTAPGQLEGMTGQLQMLGIAADPAYIAAINQQVGVPLPATWVDIPLPDQDPALVGVLGPSRVYQQGRAAGGAQFRRLEGCWFGAGKLYFHSTNGGDLGLGQLWMYDPVANTLTLIFESDDVDVLDAPDNITVSPRGGLIICEDNGGMQIMRGMTRTGQIFDFAKNIHNGIEFAGACFSPDGRTLFVNLFGRLTARTTTPFGSPVQIPIPFERSEQALTLAIWGPWRNLL